MATLTLESAFGRLSLRPSSLCRQCRRSFASTAPKRETNMSATRAFSGASTLSPSSKHVTNARRPTPIFSRPLLPNSHKPRSIQPTPPYTLALTNRPSIPSTTIIHSPNSRKPAHKHRHRRRHDPQHHRPKSAARIQHGDARCRTRLLRGGPRAPTDPAVESGRRLRASRLDRRGASEMEEAAAEREAKVRCCGSVGLGSAGAL